MVKTNKIKSKKEKKFIVIEKKSNQIMMDDLHIIAVGTPDILNKKVVDKHYNETSFSFEFLKRAEMYFRSIYGDLFDENKMRCMIADRNAPIIFIYESGDSKNVFALAPRAMGVDGY